ncbi:nitrate- and nitrite sensing domain-containing protein [Marinobacterium jannaschii]|uniref:nitrate- and nitrite sensing domain-containing protein n=1 Tax=Marinobacterium jannaschii TaxID=64970 RepID=UPI0004868B56|nr:nitrate- and nitrite sensing domain-containing protein [Marinobacterium jannaschii]
MDGTWNSATLVIVLLMLVLVTLALSYHLMQRRTRRRYIEGIEWMQQLCQLLALLQQHRGLSNGYLHGDDSARPRIAQLQQQIGQQLDLLNRKGVWIHLSGIWLGIQGHWSRLEHSYLQLGADASLKQHNRIITHLLNLIADCAENHQLHHLRQDEKQVAYLWQELLSTAEYIGQARALGTGVTAAGSCSSVDKIRLNFLHNRLSNYMSQQESVQVSSALGELLSTLRHQVIVDLPTIASQDYFKQASAVMELLMQQCQQGLTQLAEQLRSH